MEDHFSNKPSPKSSDPETFVKSKHSKKKKSELSDEQFHFSDNLASSSDTDNSSAEDQVHDRVKSKEPVDTCIDKLVEFQETEIPSTNEMTIAEVLYRLETSHDIPSAKLKNFSGDPWTYVEFIESFRIQSHQKFNLTDDQRM